MKILNFTYLKNPEKIQGQYTNSFKHITEMLAYIDLK